MVKILSLLVILSICFGCSKQGDIKEKKPTKHLLPAKLKVSGVIEEVYYGVCGTFHVGGLIKLNLVKPVKDYPHDVIYLLTSCLLPRIKINGKWIEIPVRGKFIEVNAVKATKKDESDEIYSSAIENSGNSDFPFYILNPRETEKIIEEELQKLKK